MTPLLEREDELEKLVGAVEQAAAGRGGMVLVGGEAGIGKTSLVRALRERVGETVTWMVGACEPLSVPTPLGPLRELFEAAGGGDLVQIGSDDRLVLDARCWRRWRGVPLRSRWSRTSIGQTRSRLTCFGSLRGASRTLA